MKWLVIFLMFSRVLVGNPCSVLGKVNEPHHPIHISYPKHEYVEESVIKHKYQYGDKDYLGNGSIGAVWLGVVPANCKLEGHFQPKEKEKVAVKRALFGQEKWIHHEAVISERLAENDPEGLFMRASYDAETNVLVSEYLEGMLNLEEYADKKREGFTKVEQAKILEQLKKALAVLHKVRLVHGDLKPNNIMIDPKTNNIKVIDYSLVAPIGGYPLANGVGKIRGGSKIFAPLDQRKGEPAKFADDEYAVKQIEDYLSK